LRIETVLSGSSTTLDQTLLPHGMTCPSIDLSCPRREAAGNAGCTLHQPRSRACKSHMPVGSGITVTPITASWPPQNYDSFRRRSSSGALEGHRAKPHFDPHELLPLFRLFGQGGVRHRRAGTTTSTAPMATTACMALTATTPCTAALTN
jgi:hypothetical protein